MNNAQIFICDFPDCGRQLANVDSLRLHKKIHLAKYPCDICARVFSDKSNRSRHVKAQHKNVAMPVAVRRAVESEPLADTVNTVSPVDPVVSAADLKAAVDRAISEAIEGFGAEMGDAMDDEMGGAADVDEVTTDFNEVASYYVVPRAVSPILDLEMEMEAVPVSNPHRVTGDGYVVPTVTGREPFCGDSHRLGLVEDRLAEFVPWFKERFGGSPTFPDHCMRCKLWFAGAAYLQEHYLYHHSDD